MADTRVSDLTACRACPACAAQVSTQRDTYQFARAYLCDLHKALFDAIDAREHSGGCPWAPAPCRRCSERVRGVA